MSKTDLTIKRVNRIDRLTPEQEAQFSAWRERWITAGLQTGIADRPKFEKAVTDCYRAAGLEPPKRVVWVSSPIVLALAADKVGAGRDDLVLVLRVDHLGVLVHDEQQIVARFVERGILAAHRMAVAGGAAVAQDEMATDRGDRLLALGGLLRVEDSNVSLSSEHMFHCRLLEWGCAPVVIAATLARGRRAPCRPHREHTACRVGCLRRPEASR